MSDPILEIPFAGGMDESIRSEIAEPGVVYTTLENGRYNTRGGFGKRTGYTSLVRTRLAGSDRSAGYRGLMNGDQLCVIDGAQLDVWSEALQRWVSKGRVPEASCRLLESPSVGRMGVVSPNNGDTVAVGQYVVTVTQFGTNAPGVAGFAIAATVVDSTTGAVVLGPTTLASHNTNAFQVLLATYSTHALLFAANTSTGRIALYRIDTASASSIATGWVTVTTTLSTNYLRSLAVANLSTGTTVAIAYANTVGGTNRVTVTTVDIAGQVSSSTLTTAASNPEKVGLSEGSSNLWVSWNETTNIRACAVSESNPATIVATTATVMTATTSSIQQLFVGPRAGGEAAVYVTAAASGNQPDCTMMVAVGISGGAAVADGFVTTLGATRIQSRPFLRSSRLYGHFSASTASSTQEDITLCDCTPDETNGATVTTYLRPVGAPIQRGLFYAIGQRTALVPSSTRYLSAVVLARTGSSYGAALIEYDFASPHRWRPANVNGSVVLSGGVESVFDGTRVFELAFLLRPGKVVIDSTPAGSLTFTLGGRKYVSTYEEVDADGNVHVSGVSDPSDSTGNLSSQNATVLLTPLTITSRGSLGDAVHVGSLNTSLRVVLWATKDGGNPPYYRLTEVNNDPNVTSISYTDSTSDTALESRALLYSTGNLPATNGSSQDHRAPPGMLHHVAYNGMLVGVANSTLFYSAQPIDGEGTWASPVFAHVLEERATGITVQDGTVIVFSERGAWVTSGDPPSDNGSIGGLSTPRKLAVDYGCTNASSILSTSIGTFYQSSRGLELLTRAQTNQPIGDPIQDTLATYPIVTAAALDTKNGWAIFSLASSRTDGLASATGVDVVFDIALGAWVRDVKRGGSASQASQDAFMAYIGGAWRYAWLATDGIVYYERSAIDASKHLDGATWVTQKAVTPWIHIAGIHGEQFFDQVLFLAEYVTGHDITISLAYDYGAFTSSETFTAAQLATLGKEWLVKEVGQTTSNMIRIQIEDATPSSGSVGTGAGATWIATTLNGQPHRGPKRTSSKQRGGA